MEDVQMSIVDEDIAKKLRKIVVDALSIEPEECESLDAHIINDLGAESIDFVDISFQLEKVFGLKKIKVIEIFPFLYYEVDIEETEHDEFRGSLAENYPHISPHYADRVLTEGSTECLFTLQILHDFIISKNGV